MTVCPESPQLCPPATLATEPLLPPATVVAETPTTTVQPRTQVYIGEGSLPVTGSDVYLAVGVAIALIVIGVTMLIAAGRLGRRWI